MSLEAKHFYEFKNFRLDLDERVLMRDGKPLPVTPKVFHLLKILVERHGRVVSKEDLIAEIWAGSFVEEGNLTFNVRMLRKALGDNASQPIFIETVPRRGYRFIAEVSENAALEPATATAAGNSRKKYFLPAGVLVSTVVLLAVALLWYSPGFATGARSNSPILTTPFRAEKFTNSGSVRHAVISPDGKLAVFVDRTAEKETLWLRRLETSENVQIVPPGSDYYLGLIFSRDGQSLFFVRKPSEDNAVSAVYRISIHGGSARKILERAEGWISLSPGDREISFVRCEYKDDDYCSLMIAEAETGGNERKIVTRSRPFRISDNQFSPDGKSIAFAAGQSSNGSSDFRLFKIALETGAESQITSTTFFNISNLEWLPNKTDLLLTARENIDQKSKIWQVSADSGEVRQLTKDATSYRTISLDKEARKIIATQTGNNFRLYLASNNEIKVLTPAHWATFAPDGKIIYTTNDNNIWAINRDGSEQRQLTGSASQDYISRVSPDGRFIFFTSNRTGSNQVWRMNFDGSNQIQITRQEGGYPFFVTPDGKWVYYLSGFRQTLWKASAEGGGNETQISDLKMHAPAVSPDGKLAAYFFHDQVWKIGILNLAEKKVIRIFDYADGKSTAINLTWSNDNRTLNFITRRDTRNLLWQQSLDETVPRFAADLGDGEIKDLAIAPGGEGFAFIRGEWLHDAVLIDGLK